MARATFSLENIPQWEVEIKILEVLAIGADVIEVDIVTPEWAYDIVKYLIKGKLSTTKQEAKKI